MCLRKIGARDGEQRGSRGVDVPAEEKFGGGATDASLAWAHAAASVKLCGAPGIVVAYSFEGDVFAATKEGAGLGQRLEFVSKRESGGDGTDVAAGGVAAAKEVLRGCKLARSGVTSDCAFEDGKFDAAYTGGFAGAINVRMGRLSEIVCCDEALRKLASEKLGEFGGGHEMEAAGEVVARNVQQSAVAREADRLERSVAEGGDGPAVFVMRNTADLTDQRDCLTELMLPNGGGKPELEEAGPRSLLGDADDFRATLRGVGCDGEQEWSGAGDDDALSGDRESGFQERLKCTGAHHARQCPAREGEEALAAARGEDDFLCYYF